MYDFFCHGLSSSSNSSYRRRQRISRWYGSKRRRRNSTTTHTPTTSSHTNSNNNKLHGTCSDEVPNQLQEETQTEKEAKEKTMAEQHHHYRYRQQQQQQTESDNNNPPPNTLEKQLQTSLEEVPFEVIEAEDILLWGCPPIKIPRMVFSEQQQRQLLEHSSVFYTNNNSYSKNTYKSTFNHQPSSFSLEKAASIPVYRKCRKFLTETSSDSFDFDQWDDFFNDLISRPSTQATKPAAATTTATTMKNITISWCDFNPFENLHIGFLDHHSHQSNKYHSDSHDSEEKISENDLLLNNFTTNFYHNIFATEDQVTNHGHPQQQAAKCYHHHNQHLPYEVTCEVFDVPSGDDKAVVVIQSTNKQRAFETSSIFESPIIHEYSSDGEGESLRQHRQCPQKEKSGSKSTNNSINNENTNGDTNHDKSNNNHNDDLLNITITEINSHPSFSSSCSHLSQVRKLLQRQPSSDNPHYCHSKSLSPAKIETQILFQSQHHSNSTNRTESIPSESNNNHNHNDGVPTENKIDRNGNNISMYTEEEEERKKQMEVPKHLNFEQFFDDVRMLNSLPAIFTVYNIDTDNDGNLYRQQNSNCGRHRHRRRAASVAIAQQDDSNENQPLELIRKESGNNNIYTDKTNKSKTKHTDKSEIFEVFRMKPRDSTSKLRLADSSNCDGSIIAMSQKSEFKKCRRRRSTSAPNSQTVSLMSFSPNESFASSLELNPRVLNIFEENFPLSMDEKSPLNENSSNNNNWNPYYYNPGITESMDGENFGNFGKFYPPPTPLSKKSSSKSSKNNNNIKDDTESGILINEQITTDPNNTSNSNNILAQNLESTSNNNTNGSISSKKSILKKSNNNYYDNSHGTSQMDQELDSNNTCKIKATIEIGSTTSHKNTVQKSILKNSHNNKNCPLAKGYESKSSSMKMKGAKETSQKSILKSRKSSTVKKEEEGGETEDQISINPVSSPTTTTHVHNIDSSSAVSSTVQSKSSTYSNNNNNTKNLHHLKIKKPIRNKLVLKKSSEKLRTKSKNSVNKYNKLVTNSSSSDKLSVSTTSKIKIRYNNSNNNSKSKQCKEREVCGKAVTEEEESEIKDNNKEMTESVKNEIIPLEQSNKESTKKSRSRQKPPRPKFPPRFDEDPNNSKRQIDRQHNIKFRRKSILKPTSSSSREYPMTRLRKCPEDADISEKFFRHNTKPHPTSSETTWGSTSLSLSNSNSSDEGSSSRSTRKKGRKKLTLWQKMRRIFFGCRRKSKESPYNCGNTTSINVNQTERSGSLFERIICWWRKASHRKVIVRQDSLQLIRIKRQKWLREIHEFYEDVNAVYKNPRVTERGRSSRKSTTKFENIPVKIVNSEGCILLREQTALLDAQNGNRPKEKPLKGILKNNTNKSYKAKRSKTKPSRHINYKYS